MENIHREFFDSLYEAEGLLNSADHLVYVTFPVVKDAKLLLRVLENLNKCAVKAISTILKFEYLYKRVSLSSDSKKNLEVFFSKCAGRYGLGADDKDKIKRIIYLGKKHKQAGVEFPRSGKMVILDDDLGREEIRADDVKIFIKVLKGLLENMNIKFKKGE